MSILRIKTDSGETRFKPGSAIGGDASWHLDVDVEAVEVRLFWYTTGKGTRDVGLVDCVRVDRPEPSGHRSFRFIAPAAPYSFSGKLITLAWALELVVLPGEATERVDLVIGPQPIEISIQGLREF
jgi:hypothetical protein